MSLLPRLHLLLLVLLAAWAPQPAEADDQPVDNRPPDNRPPCGGQVFCQVASGRYLAFPPAGWDGVAPLPTTVFFHGWNSSATATAAQTGVLRTLSDRGVLLLIPDGIGREGRPQGWSFTNAPLTLRDEAAFVAEVVADARARWPVDPARLVATGFSLGGSMVWDLACRGAVPFAAYAPYAGAFWDPLPEACPAPAAALRHVHGTTDRTVPLAGRPIGPAHRQGDVPKAIDIWRRHNGCPEAPTREVAEGGLTCKVWDGAACATGKELRLCLHDGGHFMAGDWPRDVQDWLAGLPAP